MSHIGLISAFVLFAASTIPFYFALKIRGGNELHVYLSLSLGLALLVHGFHHALAFLELLLASLASGLASALLAAVFWVLYYISWREGLANT